MGLEGQRGEGREEPRGDSDLSVNVADGASTEAVLVTHKHDRATGTGGRRIQKLAGQERRVTLWQHDRNMVELGALALVNRERVRPFDLTA